MSLGAKSSHHLLNDVSALTKQSDLFRDGGQIYTGGTDRHPITDLLASLRDLIQRGGKSLDVFALNRCDKYLRQVLDHLLAEPLVLPNRLIQVRLDFRDATLVTL